MQITNSIAKTCGFKSANVVMEKVIRGEIDGDIENQTVDPNSFFEFLKSDKHYYACSERQKQSITTFINDMTNDPTIENNIYSASMLKVLKNFSVTPDMIDQSDALVKTSRALVSIAEMNTKALRNEMDAGKFVDIQEAGSYFRHVFTLWLTAIKDIHQLDTRVSQDFGIPITKSKKVLKFISNELINYHESVCNEVEKYSEEFIHNILQDRTASKHKISPHLKRRAHTKS